LTSSISTVLRSVAKMRRPPLGWRRYPKRVAVRAWHKCGSRLVELRGESGAECLACGLRIGVYQLRGDSEALLARFRQLARDASSGPWEAERHAPGAGGFFTGRILGGPYTGNREIVVGNRPGLSGVARAVDADFIVVAREVADLLPEIVPSVEAVERAS